jgi:hypothetical protein
MDKNMSELEGLKENVERNCDRIVSNYSRYIVDMSIDATQKVAAYIMDVHYQITHCGIEYSRNVVVYRPRRVSGKLLPVQHGWSFLVRSGTEPDKNYRSNNFEKIELLHVIKDEKVSLTVVSDKKKQLLTSHRMPLEMTTEEYRWDKVISRIVISDRVSEVVGRMASQEFRGILASQKHREKLERVAEVLAEHPSFNYLTAIQLYFGLGLPDKAQKLNAKRRGVFPHHYAIDFSVVDWEWCYSEYYRDEKAIAEMLDILRTRGLA